MGPACMYMAVIALKYPERFPEGGGGIDGGG